MSAGKQVGWVNRASTRLHPLWLWPASWFRARPWWRPAYRCECCAGLGYLTEDQSSPI